MKRVSIDSHQSPSVDQEAKDRSRYNGLLSDYLDIQKEFVSKKKKLQAAKEKRQILSDEVRFLRQRLRYLTSIRSSSNFEYLKRDDVLVGQQSPPSQIKLDATNEAMAKNSSPVSDTNMNKDDEVKEKLVLGLLTVERRPNIPRVIKRKGYGGKKGIPCKDRPMKQC